MKSVLKTLSLTFVALAAAAAARASEQNPLLPPDRTPAEWIRATHPSQSEIDRGWERQHRLIEARLAARVTGGLSVPGAIILPPFPGFARYRIDPQAAATLRKTAKPAGPAVRQSTRYSNHD